jgi:hypothetical protein
VGTSKRYAAHYDQRMNDKILERVMAEQAPTSLSPDELELDRHTPTRAPNREAVKAGVRSGETAVKVDARVVAWTPRAVAVRSDTPGGEHRAWFWSSAVEPKVMSER